MVRISKTITTLKYTFVAFMALVTLLVMTPRPVAAACSSSAGSLLGIPTWYKYLQDDTGVSSATGRCVPRVSQFKDALFILLAVIEILLRVATYIAIAMFIYGAIRMIISQGSPDEIKKARDTLTNAVVGLVIALIATAVVNFVGRTLG